LKRAVAQQLFKLLERLDRPGGQLASGWRTAPPKAEGMDPAVLATIAGNVASLHPEIRGVLVVRHGYLVYEHYWQGMTASDGDNTSSVTKSVVSALVGIALGEGSSRAWTSPSVCCWPATSPTTPTRGLPGSPWSSCRP
jgi:hypothetical protein